MNKKVVALRNIQQIEAEKVLFNVDKAVSPLSIVNAFNYLIDTFPEATILLDNNKGISISQSLKVEVLDSMGFFGDAKLTIIVEDKESTRILDDFKKIIKETGQRIIDVKHENVLNRGFSVTNERLVFWQQPSVMDKISLDLIKGVTKEKYQTAIDKAFDFAMKTSKGLEDVGDINGSEIWLARAMLIKDKRYSYDKLSAKNDNVVKALIIEGRNIVEMFSKMDINSEKIEDIDESIVAILKELSVPHFKKDSYDFIEKESKNGSFVLVSNKFPIASVYKIGDRDGISGFVGVDGCVLSKRSHPVLVAKDKSIPVITTELSGKDVKKYSSVALVVDRNKTEIKIIFDPSAEEQKMAIDTRKNQLIKRQNDRTILVSVPNKSADGSNFQLKANINSLSQIDELKLFGLFMNDSPVEIGLVRTELLYGDNAHNYSFLIDSIAQFNVFNDLFNAVDNNVSVRIRLLDQDASKLTGMKTKQRGKSLIEANEEVYNAQIRAILDAAIRVGRKNVEIVFPMVESREHLMLGKFLVEKIMMSGLYNKADINIKVIAMIEDIQVFSAPETLINILDEADDINLGTNDFGDSLGQKRLKPETLVEYNPLEYFLYKNIIESAIALGMSPCVCGDLGGDFNWAYALTSLGATVSASSNDLHVVKKALVNAKLKKISELTLKMKDNSKIKIFLDYVADSVNVSTDELINTPTLIAKFYNKLKKSYAKNKDIYRELVLDASEQFGFELQRMQEENLE